MLDERPGCFLLALDMLDEHCKKKASWQVVPWTAPHFWDVFFSPSAGIIQNNPFARDQTMQSYGSLRDFPLILLMEEILH